MASVNLLLFLGVLFSRSSPAGGERLHISPRGNQVRDVHSKVIFSCSFEDYDPEKFADGNFELKWIGPDTQHITSNHGRIHIERTKRETVKLYIHRFEETDAGVYSCQLDGHDHDGSQVYTESVLLSLFEDIRFNNKSVNFQSRVKSKSVLLECSASGIPVPTISWRFNKTKIPEISEKYRYEEEGLRIYDVTLDDNGTYECRAQVESQGSLKMRYIHLDVLYPPVMTVLPRVVGTVVKGLDAVLRCEADGNPAVRYEWYLERRVSEFVKAKVPLHRDGSMLAIRGFGAENEGRYFCRVSNSVGTKETYIDVTMLVPPVIKDFGSQVTVEGRTLILPCELTDGRPSPDLFWSKGNSGQLLVKGNQLMDDGTISIDNTHLGISKLIIRNIQRNHAGDYTCHATNAVGNTSKTAEISVDYAPEINSSFTEVYGWTGQVRNLTCSADGQPQPAISWFTRGQHVFDTPSYKIETIRRRLVVTSTLQITIGGKQSWLFGNYTCIAKNSHGSSSVAFHLREGEVPDFPHNVSVLEVSATEAVLLAAAPRKTGGVPLTSWMVEYEKTGGGAVSGKRVFDSIPGESLMTMTVTHLESDSDYTFYLSAGNEVGFGEPIKFLVRTNQKSVLSEQSDIPHKSGNTWKDPAALEKAPAGGNDPDRVKSSSGGVALGVISILAILTLISVGGVFWHRRRRGHGGMEKCLWMCANGSSTEKKNQQQNHQTGGDDLDDVIQMGEVKQPCEEFLQALGGDGAQGPTAVDSTLKATDSFESGFGLSPKPRHVFSPAKQVRSLTVTPMSVRRLGGDQNWSQTHESNDDLSSGFGTAEPESIQSDLVLGPDDEAGTRGGLFAQHDPDLDSIPDIDDDEEDIGQL